ncbi:hypothetical protein PENTCL1PPCAC_29256, partial [Pristionchus entomophagus]
LVLLPLLFFSANADCFNATIRFRCNYEGHDRDYYGPVVTTLWDDNYPIFGGDKKILTVNTMLEIGKPTTIEIKDPRDDCWFYEPYVKIISYCPNKAKQHNKISKEWHSYFIKTFGKSMHSKKNVRAFYLSSACRKIPSNSSNVLTIQLANEHEC